MRRFFTLLFLTAALFSAYTPTAHARASQFSADELLKMCNSTYDTDYGYCAGFVGAVSNVLLDESVGGYRACNHAPVRAQQAIEIFKSYAELFPEGLKGEASIAVAASIARAFPCK